MNSKELYELMWACHRAESEGALTNDFQGTLPSMQGDVIEANPTTVSAFNQGVAQGITALLSHLSKNGYRIIGPLDAAIYPNQNGDLGEAFVKWTNTPTPGLALVTGTGYVGNRGWKDGVYNPDLPVSKLSLPADLPQIKGVVLKGSNSLPKPLSVPESVTFTMQDGRVHLDGVPIKFAIEGPTWGVESSYSEYPLQIRFKENGSTYVISGSLGRPYIDRLMEDLKDYTEEPDDGCSYEVEASSVTVSKTQEFLKWLVPDTEPT